MQYAEYMDSVEASANRAKVAFEGMFINALDSDAIKQYYDAITVITKLIDKIGLVNVALFGMNAFIVSSSDKMMKSLKAVATGVVEQTISISSLSNAFSQGATSGTIFNSVMDALGIKLTIAQFKIMAVQAALTFGLAIAFTAVTNLIVKFIGNISKANEEQEKFLENQKKTYHQNTQNISQLEQLNSQYLKATRGTEEYHRIQNQIADLMPQVIKHYDEEGNAVYATAEEVKGLIEEQKRLNAERAKTVSYEMGKDLEKEAEKLSKINKDIEKTESEFNERVARVQVASLVDKFLSDEEIQKLDKNSNEYKNKLREVYEESNRIFEEYNVQGGSGESLAKHFYSGIEQSAREAYEKENALLVEISATRQGFLDNLNGITSQFVEKLKFDNGRILNELEISDKNVLMLLDNYAQSFKDKNEITKDNIGSLAYKYEQSAAKIAQTIQELQESGKINLVEMFETGDIDETFAVIESAMKETGVESDVLKDLFSKLKSQQDENINTNNEHANSQNKVTGAMKENADAISDSISDLEKTQSILDKLRKEGMSLDIVKDIASNYPELLGYISSETTLRQKLIDKVGEQRGVLDELYQQAMFQDNELYKNKVANNASIQKNVQDTYNEMLKMLSGYVNNQNEPMKINFQQYKNLEEVKQAITKDLLSRLDSAWSKFFTGTEINFQKLQREVRGMVGQVGDDLPIAWNRASKTLVRDVFRINATMSGAANSLASGLGAGFKAVTSSIPISGTKSSKPKSSSNKKDSSAEKAAREAFRNWMESVRRNSELLEFQLEMNKLDQSYEEGVGNTNEFIKLKIKEGNIYKDLNKVYQSNINKIKAKMKTVKSTSDEYYELQDALHEYTQAIRQNEIAIVQNKKELEEYNKTLRDGVISAQELVLDAVKNRVKLEYEANKQILNDKIKFLQRERQLLRDEYNARQQEKEEQKKQERLKELEDRYNKLSLDNSKFNEKAKLDLKNEIERLKEEIYEDSLLKEIEAQEESIDNQIENYEKEQQALEDKFSAMEETMQGYWNEVDRIMKGSQDSIINYLKENSEEYRKAGKLQKEAFLEGWGDTIKFAKDVMGGKLKPSDQLAKEPPKPSPKPSTSTSGTSSSSSSTKAPKIGGKVKVSASNAKAYMDSYGKNVRPWADQAKAAGVGYGSSMYLVNQRNGYGALSKTNNVNGAIAWVKMSDLVGLKTGGYTGDSEGIAYLHKKEMVLNADDTKNILDATKVMDRILKLVPNLKTIDFTKGLALPGGKNPSSNYNFGDIIVEVEKLENDTDFERLGSKVKDSIYNSIKGLGGQFSVPKLR